MKTFCFALAILLSANVARAERSELCGDMLAGAPLKAAKRAYEQIQIPSLANKNNGRIQVDVKSRTEAERYFEQQQEMIDAASGAEDIPVEIIVAPFYYPFWHTSVRVGKALYEFTDKGWESHDTAYNGARGFLFNNPFFRKRYSEIGAEIPYFSLGITVQLNKNDVFSFVAEIKNEPLGDGNFNFLSNNCNHCVLRAFERNGIDLAERFSLNGYLARTLSSRLFRRLLEKQAMSRRANRVAERLSRGA